MSTSRDAVKASPSTTTLTFLECSGVVGVLLVVLKLL
jgi:hypothetical protein